MKIIRNKQIKLLLASTPIDPLEDKIIFGDTNKLPEKSFYFKPFPEIRVINSGVVNAPRKRGFLLPNGNDCKVLKIEREGISVRDTCPFDSVIQLIQFGAIDYPKYNAAIQSSKNKALQFVSKFLKNGPTIDILKDRTMILKNIYVLKKVDRAISLLPFTLNARDTIREVWTKLFLDMNPNEPSGSKTYLCSNLNCKGPSKIELPVLSINGQYGGFYALEKALDYFPKIKNMKCTVIKCIGPVTEETSLNMHILIETDVNTTKEPQTRRQCQLAEFPVILNLQKPHMYDNIICCMYFRINNYS